MLTVQEILDQFADDYRILADNDARFLTIHAVSPDFDFFSPKKLRHACSQHGVKCLKGHAEISDAARFLSMRQDKSPPLLPEIFLLTAAGLEADSIRELKKIRTRLGVRAIVLMQTKVAAEELYLILLEKINRENRETKKFISKDFFRLTELLNNGADIKEMEKAARQILGNPMIITDESYKVLFEKEDRLGGNLYYVALPDFKSDFRAYMDYLIHAVEKSGAKILKGTEATVDLIKDGGFDAVIVATGATSHIPDLPGAEDGGIYDALDVLDGNIPEGEQVIVGGAGLVGCELAMFLAEKGKKVTMVDMISEPAPDMPIYSRWVLNGKLAELEVTFKGNFEITVLSNKSVSGKINGEEQTLEADAVVCALGLKPRKTLTEELRQELPGAEIIPVGDTNEPRKIIQAVHEGYHAARRI